MSVPLIGQSGATSLARAERAVPGCVTNDSSEPDTGVGSEKSASDEPRKRSPLSQFFASPAGPASE